MALRHSVAAMCLGSFRWQMTVIEIIIADLHGLSNGGRAMLAYVT